MITWSRLVLPVQSHIQLSRSFPHHITYTFNRIQTSLITNCFQYKIDLWLFQESPTNRLHMGKSVTFSTSIGIPAPTTPHPVPTIASVSSRRRSAQIQRSKPFQSYLFHLRMRYNILDARRFR